MPAELPPSVALVTGGTSGIGLAAAEQLAELGHVVYIAGRDPQKGAAAAADLVTRTGAPVEHLTVDVRHEQQLASAVDVILERHGRLDIAVNAAGIGVRTGPTVTCDEAGWLETVDVNLNGVWRAMKHELRAMTIGGSGAIVNVAGAFGTIGAPGRPAYVAAKHGVLGLTKSAALEHARSGIRVNAVCPGLTRTPMLANVDEATLTAMSDLMPIGRMAEPAEIASAITYLVSPGASFVTGHALAVDGGWVIA